jgi:hypothetical protein
MHSNVAEMDRSEFKICMCTRKRTWRNFKPRPWWRMCCSSNQVDSLPSAWGHGVFGYPKQSTMVSVCHEDTRTQGKLSSLVDEQHIWVVEYIVAAYSASTTCMCTKKRTILRKKMTWRIQTSNHLLLACVPEKEQFCVKKDMAYPFKPMHHGDYVRTFHRLHLLVVATLDTYDFNF